MSAQSPYRTARSGLRTLLIVSGLLSLVAGLVIVVWPNATAIALTWVIAAYAVVAGVIYLGVALFGRTLKGWARLGHVLLGALFIVTGVIAMLTPALSAALIATIVVTFVAISWIIEGVAALTTLSLSPSRGWTIFFAVVSILAGIAIIFAPVFAAAFFLIWFGASLIAIGVFQLIRGITLPRD